MAPGQGGQPPPTGYDHRRCPSAGEQRRDLALARRIVEHDQDLAVADQVAVYLRALVQAIGYRRNRMPNARRNRSSTCSGPTGCEVPRAGRRTAARRGSGRPAMRGVHRDAGLAHSSLARDHHDPHRRDSARPPRRDQVLRTRLTCSLRPVKSAISVGRRLGTPAVSPAEPEATGGQVEGRIRGQDGVLKLLQPLAGLDPQLVDQGLPGVPVRLQASAARSQRYRASISWPRSRSRSGNVLDELGRARLPARDACPARVRASIRSSLVAMRRSSSRLAAIRTSRLSMPSSAGPRQSRSASR